MRHLNNKRISSAIIVFYTLISLVIIFEKDIFSIYDKYSIFILMVLSIFSFCVNPIIRRGELIFVILFAIYLGVAIKINNGGIGSIFTFLIPVLMLISYKNSIFSKKQESIVKHTCVIIILFLLIESIIYHGDWYYYRFNAINPNTMGMYGAFSLMTWFAFADLKKNDRIKAIILSILVLVSMILYESRATMAITIMYVIVVFYFEKFIQKKTVIISSLCIMIIGVLIPFIYLSLFTNGIEFTILGKSLYTGRELIWASMISKLNSSIGWLFGLGSNVTYWNDTVTNVHNNYFAVIIDFGIIGFVLYFGLLMKTLISIDHYENPQIRRLVLQFIFFVMFLGFTEVTTLYSTIYPLSLLGIGWASSMNSKIEGNTYG